MQGKTLVEFWEEARRRIRERKSRGEPEFPTGIGFIDDLTDGIHRGELWTLAARTGFGKTALAMQIARNIADSPQKSVLFITLEMQGHELALRMFSEFMEIEFSQLRQGDTPLSYEDKARVFSEYVKNIDFEIVEYGYTFKEIEKILTSYYGENKPDVVFIDFIQLIEIREDERLAIQEYVRKLAELAKKENIAIVLVSQVRRLPSGADYNRPPDIIDLKGSGHIEQLSHVVIILYRTMENVLSHEITKYFIKVAKNRHGDTGDHEVIFQGKYYKFKEIPQTAPAKNFEWLNK